MSRFDSDDAVPAGPPPRQQQPTGVQRLVPMTQRQHEGQQMQSQGKKQERTREEQAELEAEAKELNADPGGPLSGNQPQAGNLPGGEARPVWDQYEVNSPSAMQQPQQVGADRQREQAEAQKEQSGAEDDERGFGYGAEDGEEMEEAPDASSQDERGYGDADKARGESEG